MGKPKPRKPDAPNPEPVAGISPARQVQLALATALEPFYGPLHRKRIERAIEAERAELDGEVPAPPTTSKKRTDGGHGPGRPTKHFVAELAAQGRGWLDGQGGVPETQKELEEYLESVCKELKVTYSDNRIRAMARGLIAAYRMKGDN
jgi:hypothetical protein